MLIKIFLIFITISIFVGCKTPQGIIYLRNENNRQQIKLSQNQEMVISLKANPSTGYAWTISNIDANIIKQLQESEFKPDSEKIGSPGKQTFRFRVIAPGQTELRLIYHRSWEKGVAPIDTFVVHANVSN